VTDSVRMEADTGAPAQARKWIAGRVRLDPIRQAQLEILVSEAVTALVAESPGHGVRSPLEIEVDRGPAALRISIRADDRAPVVLDDLRRRVFDGLSRRWAAEAGPDGPTLWFEVRSVGSGDASMRAADVDELLRRAGIDPDACEEVMRRFAPLAYSIAHRFRGKGVADADLEQTAMLGMFRALDRYDPGVGAFEPFAARTISGELKRYLRDRAWSMRVPRGLQERSLEVARARQHLTQRLARDPTPSDIAADLGLSVGEVVEAMVATLAFASSSLDTPATDDGGPLTDSIGHSDPLLEMSENWQTLRPALEALPERERQVVFLRFYQEMTQSEIAEVIGVSQMHVSRVLARALDRLHALIG
jgi:RNA polymerase sigma-B factor